MVTLEQLRQIDLQIDELHRKIAALRDKLEQIENERKQRKKKELEEEKKAAEEETASEGRFSKISRLLRRMLKKERALETMTHNERVKELAAKARNFSAMLYDAEQAEIPENRRLRDLIALIVAQEKVEYSQEEKKSKIMKEMHDLLLKIKTENLEALTDEENENNIRYWAQFHGCLRQLGIIDEQTLLNEETIRRARAEVIPLIRKNRDLNKKIKAWLDWLRNLEEEERKIIETEEQAA